MFRERDLELTNLYKKGLRLTADKGEIKNFHKLSSATSFIRNPLGEIAVKMIIMEE